MKKSINTIFLLTVITFIFLSAFIEKDQIFQTSLRITVRNELGNVEEGVSVEIFKTEEDYKKETNPVVPAGITDNKGNVTFKDLESQIYFVNAEKGDKNNFGGGVQTDTLKAGRLNKVTIVIE